MSDKPIPEGGARDPKQITLCVLSGMPSLSADGEWGRGGFCREHGGDGCLKEYVPMRAAPPQGETPPPEHVFVACWCDPMCCDIGKEGCHADKGSDYCRLPRNMHAAPPPERGRAEPRSFTLIRVADESGVSGTGRVLDGVLFHTGQVVICWRTDIEAAKHGHSSLGVYPSWEAFEFLHIKSHPTNETEIRWL